MDKHVSVKNNLHKINISTVLNPEVPQESNLVQDITLSASPAPAVSKTLSDAMQRRVADFRLSRRDLSVRITESLALIDREIAESERRLQELRPRREHLVSIAAELKRESPLDIDGATTQAQIAAETRRLEDLRLDACRMIAESGMNAAGKQSHAKSPSASDGIDLDSLTFGQLCRVGWGVFFPFIIAVILGTLLIGAAVIMAFNWRLKF